MKATRFTKRFVSLVLSLLMILSMITVGLITANSAEVDTTDTQVTEMSGGNVTEDVDKDTGDDFDEDEDEEETDLAESGSSGTFTVYFNNTVGWSNVYVCLLTGSYWDNDKGTGSYDQTIHKMTKGTGNYYSYTYTGNYCEYINFVQDEQTNYGNYWQTKAAYRGDFNPSLPCYNPPSSPNETKNETQYYSNGTWSAAPSAPSTQAPTQAPSTEYTVYFADHTDGYWIGNDNAAILLGDTEMAKSVDEHTGWTVWYAKVNIANNTNVTIKRVSAIDHSTVWNTWTGTFNSSNPCYVATDDNQGSWGTAPTLPAGTATDFWYGIWVDTKGNGDTKDFVKIFANDYSKDSTYYLYLPSYTDWTQLKVYTSFASLTIGGVNVTPHQVNTMNLSFNTIEGDKLITFKRYSTEAQNSGTLHIIRSGSPAMLMTTKDELYTGLCAAYADNGDGTANYEGVAAYKSLVSTKGDYVFYDKYGNQENPTDKTTGEVLTGIKKLKARGNSTFEASMRLYGKTAYNITLNDKVKLIDGCESSKKYSLLANNADETMLRNRTVYGIADAVGMPYTPNTRVIDLYDNGTYLGTYVLTEKVEYGKNTLIPDAKSLDKFNEDILAAGKGIDYDALEQKTATYTAASGTTYTYQYSYTKEAGKTYEFDGSTVTIGEGDDAESYTLDETTMKKYDFLIEHEINGRYQPEGTWFVSNRTKQAVVPKYPEFATQKEVQWMIEQYDALETAAYAKNYTNLSAVADVESFASTYLIQELTENLDAGATSYYILGGKSYPKLLAAPLWDYDWAAGMYNGKKLTVSGEVDVADYSKKFVTEKSVKIDSTDGRSQSTRNLQAQMTQIPAFWTECKRVWTNKFKSVLDSYLGDGKTLMGDYLPEIRTTAYMNESRWNVLHKMNVHPELYWGTRSTTQYKKGSYSFAIGGNKCTGATYSYDNTVYYLNDWLTKRREFMDKSTANGGLGLYDTSLIETEAPTETPTAEPTAEPTVEPTAEPTAEPTEEPTVIPTEAPIPQGYYLVGKIGGDVDQWNVKAYNVLLENPAVPNEYMIDKTFLEGDAIKVVYFNGVSNTYFPDGEGNDFEITAALAGDCTVYFRADGNPEWENGWFYVAKNEPQTETPTAEPTEEPTVEPTAEPTEPPTQAPTEYRSRWVFLVGTMTTPAWDTDNESYPFVSTGGDDWDEYTIEHDVDLTAGTEIKVITKFRDPIQWYPEGYEANYTIPQDGKYHIVLRPGKYHTDETWFEGVLKVTLVPDPTAAPPTEEPTAEPTEEPTEPPTTAPDIEDGYYLVGKIGGVTNWSIVSADNKLTANPNAEGEYTIEKTFSDGDAIKVVKVESNVITTWYKDGTGNEYNLTDAGNKTGLCTVYFRPDGNPDWSYNYLTVIKKSDPTAEPTQAPTAEPTAEPTQAPTSEPTSATSAPSVEDGYYLMGIIGGVKNWSTPLAENKLTATSTQGEYKIEKTFINNDAVKVVEVKNGAIKTWYKDGEGNEYKLTEAGGKTGDCTVYFRPAGNSDWTYTYLTVIKKTTPTTVDPTASTAVTVTYRIGDADGDGDVTVLDATKVQRVIASLDTDPDDMIKTRGKVTNDTSPISVIDATNIQRFLATLTTPNCRAIGELTTLG